MDYKNAGVDIEAGYESVELMKKYVKGTMRPEVLGGLGGFSGAFSMEAIKGMEEPVLLSGTDGCGTKVKLAFLLDKHDTIGIDCVAMCVNDVACAVFLKKTKRQGCMLWIPMVFMMAVTFTALGMTIYKLTKALFSVGLDLGNSLQLIFAVLLLILGVLVAIQGVKKLCEKSESKKAAA